MNRFEDTRYLVVSMVQWKEQKKEKVTFTAAERDTLWAHSSDGRVRLVLVLVLLAAVQPPGCAVDTGKDEGARWDRAMTGADAALRQGYRGKGCRIQEQGRWAFY